MNGRRIALVISIALLCAACALEGVIEAPSYTVEYLANGGTGRMENSVYMYGTEKELNSNSFTRSGYVFTGWGVVTEGPVVYQDKQKIKNLTKTNGETISLYAQWEAVVSITYNVAYNANNGTGTMANSVHTVGVAKSLTANTFTRSGYTFAGWASTPTGPTVYADRESVLNLANTQGATITLYAKWEGVSYYVAYNANNGIGTMANTVHIYGTPQNLPANTFTRVGYIFAGWAESGNGPVIYADQQILSNLTTTEGATVTLYAQWSDANAHTYTVVYDRNGGTGTMESSVHTYGVAKSLTANTFTRSGYTFTGWGTVAAGPMVYGDEANVLNLTEISGETVILYAQWTVNTYTVTYNTNGGTGLMANSEHTYGTAQNLRANTFTRVGYIFAGWATSNDGPVLYTDQQSVNNLTTTAGGTVILYAQWSEAGANTYTVVYDRNGGTGTMESSVHTYGVAKSLTANTFTRSGYTFTGWGTVAVGPVTYGDEANVLNLTETSGGTVILYAQWSAASANTYTVIYDRNGGTGTMESSVHTYGVAKPLTANTFTRSGYTFTGWGTSAAGPGPYGDQANVLNLTETSGGTVILYAQWTVNTYTVTYNANGGTGLMVNSEHTYGVAKPLNANTFTRTGYTFTGWGTAVAGPMVYADQANVINLSDADGAVVTLYAVWEEVNTGLPAPANVQAEAQSMSTITIRWDSVSGASSYNIYRSIGNTGNFTKLNSAAVTGTSYNDNYLTPSTTYYYQLCTIDGSSIEGAKSTAVFATTNGLPSPINVSARVLSASSIVVSWDSLSGASSYNIYRAETETGNYIAANVTVNTGTTFTDTGLSASTTYYYKVCGVTGGAEGNLSTATHATTAVVGTIVEGSSLAQKLAWLQTNAVSNTGYTLEVFADENISPTSLSYSGRSNITVALSGIGANRTINLSSNGSIFTVATSNTLILDNNITLRGRTSNNASLVRVNSGGSLEMRGNTKITGNTVTSSSNSTYGGGVYVDNGANFTMCNSSSVSGNTANGTGGPSLGFTRYAGYGGGVYVAASGNLTMRDDSIISGNSARSNNTGYGSGGGVYFRGETFIMQDNATVSGNTATGNGGGVSNGGTFRITGGTIYGSNAEASLRNTGTNAALAGTAEYGTFSGNTFISAGDLTSTDNTIRVVNGVLQNE
jgi:uncharacterized repeat protein (TIGR02543 family)